MEKNIAGGHLAAAFTALLWGTTFISTKVLLEAFHPVEILVLRFAIGYIALWIISPKPLRQPVRSRELYFAAAGLCGVTLYFLLENIALTYTMASNVGVIVSIAPCITALIASRFLEGERLRAQFFVGFAAAIGGIVLISFNGNFLLQTNPLGDTLAALSAVTWAVYSILIRKISAFGYPTVQTTRRVFFYGLLFMIPGSQLFQFSFDFGKLAVPVNLFNVLYLGFGASAVCFVTWNWAVKTLGAVKTSVYIYMVPVVTVIASALILREQITWIALAGTALTLLGLVLSEGRVKLKRERRRQHL